MLACTSYSEPRKFLMVRAFAGDSTMTSFLAISVVWVGGGTHRTTRWRVCVKTRVGVYTFGGVVVFWGCFGVLGSPARGVLRWFVLGAGLRLFPFLAPQIPGNVLGRSISPFIA